jgi:hypothetical protein
VKLFKVTPEGNYYVKKKSFLPISKKDLENVAFDIAYVIIQCSSFIIWELNEKQLNNKPDKYRSNYNVFRNSLLEAHLLFIRKLNAFFSSQKSNREQDDVYAFDFPGFDKVGYFLEIQEKDELNLRVGHISLREARYGKKNWPNYDWYIKAIEKSLPFLDYLIEDFFKEQNDFKNKMILFKNNIINTMKAIKVAVTNNMSIKSITTNEII